MDRDLASLSDIRRVATELMAMREKYALDAVLADDVLTSAVLHKAIVMGEAANRVSAAGRAKLPTACLPRVGRNGRCPGAR